MNILILTSIYPQNDDEKNAGVTPVVKYFAREWVKTGNNVIVIHNSSRYPQLIYLLPKSWLKRINAKFGIVIPNKKQSKKTKSFSDGVICYRLPMLKLIPKTKFINSQVNIQFDKIINILKNEKFSPDIIIGHWENPQVQLLPMFKQKFKVKTAIVLHGLVYMKQKRYKKWAKENIKKIDVIGARSKAIANQAKELLSLDKDPFICYSGINDKYFDELKSISFDKKTPNSYLYVGRLIARKNIDIAMNALKSIYDDNVFIFNIVGEGAEEEKLLVMRNNLRLQESVRLLGYKKRDEVMKIMKETEVFIMISDNETFGLVYLEAMSRGCIVIASRNGGMDGIIKHGYNGFFCDQGNKHELEMICNKINKMTIEEKTRISLNAMKTALNFRDSQVAKEYLVNVIDS